MTRLTSEDISNVESDAIGLDDRLVSVTGHDVRTIALEAAGLPQCVDLSGFQVAVVPITSGLGEIGGFARSLDAIARHIGMRSHVTSATDVSGFAEAVESGVDIVMMADDDRFIAYNTLTGTCADNALGTAMGYSVVLRDAAGGLRGSDVLVVGAGFVGTQAARILRSMGAVVTVTDIVPSKAAAVAAAEGVAYMDDVREAVSSHWLILNASPGEIPGEWIREGSIISSPGVPFSFDDEAMRRADVIVHDPLEIGSASMLTMAVAETIRKTGRVNMPLGLGTHSNMGGHVVAMHR